MSVTQLKEQLQTDSSLVVLDVRTAAELENTLGKIDGVINKNNSKPTSTSSKCLKKIK